MSKDKATASADQAHVPAAKAVDGVKLGRHPLTSESAGHPFARFKGKAPKSGEVLEFKLENGVTYTGIVSEAKEADGEVLAEFKDGVTPVLQK